MTLTEIHKRKTEAERARVRDDADLIRARCKSLFGFVREAWHVLEPRTTFVPNWHLEAICAHLEAVSDGRINRLLINVPPGSMKSLIVSVLWQAWEWGPHGAPYLKYISTAFNENPVIRDTRKSRDLMLSDWYQTLWPHVQFSRRADLSFANTAMGSREGIPFNALTSQRGDRLILDDPHSVEKAESDVDRVKTTRNFRESAFNRLNDQERSAIVVIMQRLHEADVAGTILDLESGYVHLMLPMEFEIERRCSTSIGFVDPRVADGDLLDPRRFPWNVIEQMKKETTAHAWASQYQQRPAPRGGNLFKRAWFEDRIIDNAPLNVEWVRHWDLAATARKNAARTAGVKIGRTLSGQFIVGHVVLAQEEGPSVDRIITATAQADGVDVAISLPQDPGQAGKVRALQQVQMLAGFDVHAEPETGEKAIRALPFAAQCEIGNVFLVRGSWNENYLDELCLFPSGKFADQVDASVGAFVRLTQYDAPTVTFGTYDN